MPRKWHKNTGGLNKNKGLRHLHKDTFRAVQDQAPLWIVPGSANYRGNS